MATYKLAVIKDEKANCPFGLPIPFACKNVGETVNQMTSLDTVDEKDLEAVFEANNYILKWNDQVAPCIYFGHEFEDKVICNFDEGLEANLTPSSSYFNNFSTPGMTGAFSLPIVNYLDNSLDRAFYFGPVSMQEDVMSKENDQEIVKPTTKK